MSKGMTTMGSRPSVSVTITLSWVALSKPQNPRELISLHSAAILPTAPPGVNA